MNKVFLIGNLTRDPQLSYTPNDTAVCKFNIAVSRNYANEKGEKIVDFFNCTAWRGMAENIAKYTSKGSKVAVIGTLESRNYKDKYDKNHSVIEIHTSEIEFLSATRSFKQQEDAVGMKEVDSDELPF